MFPKRKAKPVGFAGEEPVQQAKAKKVRSGRARKKKSLGDDYLSEPDSESMEEKVGERNMF